MRRIIFVAALAASLVLAGCATTPPQAPVALVPAALNAQSGRVGIALTPVPKLDTAFPGAGCLLCLGVASAANSSLTAHVKTLSTEDVLELKARAAALVRKKGATAVVLDEPITLDSLPAYQPRTLNFAPRDLRGLREKLNVDKLLVVEIQQLAMVRNYASYVPTSEPKAVFAGKAWLVDLRTNGFEWLHMFNATKAAEGKWDEPPKFPDLTNAYFQAVELGKDQALQPLQ